MVNSRTEKIRNALRDARSARGMSAEALARLVGVSKTTIYRYEKGEIEKMPMQTLNKLSKILGISPAFIAGIDDEPSLVEYLKKENGSLRNSIVHGAEEPLNSFSGSSTVMIPILGEIACGDPITAEENIDGYLEEPEDSLPNGTLFYLKAKGHSMEPTIPNGSNVLIKEQPTVEDGQIAAVLVNGNTEATLKRVKHQNGIIILLPDNSSYDPIIITEDNPVKVLGKAIRFTTNL